MKYVYRSEDGQELLHEQSMNDRSLPPLEIIEEGIVYRRVWAAPQIIYRASGFMTYDRSMQDPVQKWEREELSKY